MSTASTLTKYPAGSMREIGSLALPMMLMAFSTSFMVFLDRIILGYYSLEAMNSVAAATSAALPFIFGAWAVTAIAEVFVGQFNGAKKHLRVGKPVWQMIWFSLFTLAFFLPAGLWAGPFILSDAFRQEGLPYYEWIMSTGFLMPLNASVASFFVGRGSVKLVTIMAVLGNLLNLGLDIILVFGIPDFLDPMGPKGAAIATVFAEVVQIIVLLVAFLKPTYRKNFNTHVWRFHWPTFKKCLDVGVPNAVSHLIEFSAWYVIFIIMGLMGKQHITILQIGQTLFILFTFLADGLQKGVIALSSNAIGEGKIKKVPRILISSIKLHVCMVGLLAIPFLFFPEAFIKLFLGSASTALPIEDVLHHGRIALAWVWAFLFFDDLVWIIAGILTAAGDTKFVMIMNSISTWFFGVMPVYVFVFLLKSSPVMVWQLMALYGFLNFLFFLWRYNRGQWKKFTLTA